MIRWTYGYFFCATLFVAANSASFTKELSKDLVNDNVLYSDNFEEIKPASEDQLLKQDKQFWFHQGTRTLRRVVKEETEDVPRVAKNVVFFLADGMGATTATAARIYKGQRAGKIGEEHTLSFEEFPNVALVKTYDVDMQVPDSASTATALFTGVKSRYKTLGVDANVYVGEFDKATYNKSRLDSFMVWAQEAGKATGIVTTTRITHATPAATYSRTPHRDWECDSFIPYAHRADLKDIARQLVEDAPGKNFNVILGGGQEQLGYVKLMDTSVCPRDDGLNLTSTWLNNRRHSDKATLVVNKAQLEDAKKNADYLLGLFAPNHLPYELVRKGHFPNVPSLTEMTQAALEVLRKGTNGFVLMVEAGLIDKAHHDNLARCALDETSELDDAVALVLRETGPDTLIIVTSDHSHSFTFSGYPLRGNDIMGFTNESLPYPSLSYANGPGFKYHYNPDEKKFEGFPWRDPTEDDSRLKDPFYQQAATFYRFEDTHGGEDVPVYSKGPGAHLLRGVIEQNYVAHMISYAACIGPHARLNRDCGGTSSAPFQRRSRLILGLVLVKIIFF
ncbi:hypothetical protein RI129_012695 [Pyrocoelia pectoralis]|uniref:Alkaline phosphatase n=1 Tax=Pyrocoelia pectoralis TaxID=417401 RepID=A0AAN7UU26_9COLE